MKKVLNKETEVKVRNEIVERPEGFNFGSKTREKGFLSAFCLFLCFFFLTFGTAFSQQKRVRFFVPKGDC